MTKDVVAYQGFVFGAADYEEEHLDGIIESNAIRPDDDGHIIIDMDALEGYDRDKIRTDKFYLGYICEELREEDEYRRDAMIRVVGGTEEETLSLDEITKEHHDDLVRVRAQVQMMKERETNTFVAAFKCQNRHIKKFQQQRWREEPWRGVCCSEEDEDGNECKANFVRRMPKMGAYGDVQRLALTESGKDDRSSRTIVGEVDRHLIGAADERDVIDLWARVKIAEPDNESKLEPYLHIVGVEQVDEGVELDEETVNKVETLADEQDNIIETLAQSVAPHIVARHGHETARKALLASLVRGGDLTDRDALHSLLYGRPGTGKSDMLEFAEDIAQKSQYVDGTEASGPGLTASTVSDTAWGDGWVVEAGAIPQADEGVVAVDELDKLYQEAQQQLNIPMSSQVVNIQRSGADELPADVSLMAAANPTDNTYDGESPLKSLDIPSELRSRFDLIVRVDNETQKEETEREVQEEILRRQEEGVDDTVDKQTLSEYVAYARQQEVSLSDAARDAIIDYIVQLKMEVSSTETDLRLSGREQAKLKRLSESMTKLRLGNTITVTDVDRAWELMMDCYQGLTFDAFSFSSSNLLTAMSLSSSSRHESAMRQALGALRISSDDDGVANLDAVESSVDASDDATSIVIDLLEDEGYITVDGDDVMIDELPGDEV